MIIFSISHCFLSPAHTFGLAPGPLSATLVPLTAGRSSATHVPLTAGPSSPSPVPLTAEPSYAIMKQASERSRASKKRVKTGGRRSEPATTPTQLSSEPTRSKSPATPDCRTFVSRTCPADCWSFVSRTCPADCRTFVFRTCPADCRTFVSRTCPADCRTLVSRNLSC